METIESPTATIGPVSTIPPTPKAAVGQSLGPADTPFDTGDGIRALAYYFGGAELADQMWVTNLYTLDGLRKLGFSGLKPQEAALAAVKAQKPGKIRFLFKRRPDRSLEIFNDQERQLKDVDLEGREVFDRLITQLLSRQIDADEFKVRVTCLVLKTRVEFMNAWKHIDPLIQVEDSGRIENEKESDPTQGGKINHPGFKIISANASEKTKQHLKI